MIGPKELARRVLLNLLDENSPATNRAIVLDSLFDLIPVDEAAAATIVFDAAAIMAAVVRDMQAAAPGTIHDLIEAHTT